MAREVPVWSYVRFPEGARPACSWCDYQRELEWVYYSSDGHYTACIVCFEEYAKRIQGDRDFSLGYEEMMIDGTGWYELIGEIPVDEPETPDVAASSLYVKFLEKEEEVECWYYDVHLMKDGREVVMWQLREEVEVFPKMKTCPWRNALQTYYEAPKRFIQTEEALFEAFPQLSQEIEELKRNHGEEGFRQVIRRLLGEDVPLHQPAQSTVYA